MTSETERTLERILKKYGYTPYRRRSFLDTFIDLHTSPDDLELYRPPESYYTDWWEYGPQIRAYFDQAIADLGLQQPAQDDKTGKTD